VVRLIDHCPEKLRVVAWLHHVDGLDQGEVARVLDVSRRTVVNRLAEFAERAQRFIARAAS
jgi:RNA polymerase sigma-70 factor (ECF subfamily)